MAALGPAYHTPVAWGATAPPHSAARAFAVAPPVPAFLAPGVGGAATASLARCHRQELRYHRRPQAAAGAATAAWAEASLFPRARLGARALRALVMMSASDSGGGGGPGATEVPEATRKLLEQAAKARAEVRDLNPLRINQIEPEPRAESMHNSTPVPPSLSFPFLPFPLRGTRLQ